MSGKGWMLLFLLLWLASSSWPDWSYIIAIALIYLWMKSEYNRTGRQPLEGIYASSAISVTCMFATTCRFHSFALICRK